MPPLTPHADFEEKWRGRFEQFASGHEDDAGISGWSERGLNARFRNFERLWSSAPGLKWLDVGCGAGTYTRLLSAAGKRVIALDYSLPTLKKARVRIPPAVVLCQADVRRLPLPPDSFDGALCFGVLQAIADPTPALDELAAALRPGASLWVDALNRYCLPSLAGLLRRRISGRNLHLRYDSPFALRDAFQTAGFSHVQIHWVPIAPHSLHALQPLIESVPVRLVLRYCTPLALLVSHAFVVSGSRSIRQGMNSRV